MGKEVTEARKQMWGNMIKWTRDIINKGKLKGTSTETYLRITTPELSKKDFEFKLPADAIFKESSLESF